MKRKERLDTAVTTLAMLRGLTQWTMGMEVGFRPVGIPLLGHARKLSYRMFPRIHGSWCSLVQRSRSARCTSEWNKLAAEVISSGKPLFRTCFAGLRQACHPIYYNDKVVGILLSVAVVPSTEGGSFKSAYRAVRLLGPERSAWNRAYARISSHNMDSLSRGMRLITNIVESILRLSAGQMPDPASETADILGVMNEHVRGNTGNAQRDMLPDPPIQNPHMDLHERAIRHMAGNYSSIMDSTDLARTLGCSRITLGRKFKKATGAGIPSFLNRIRIEKAKNLLGGTALSVAAIASRVGFRTKRAFHVAFRKEVGMSPGTFRANLLRK